MNRNVESHFAVNPANVDIPRSQFDRSSGVKFSANVGQCIPFFIDEVLPGDTFKVETSKIVRFQTMLKPIMDNLSLDIYFFGVPCRIIWEHWQNFMGESKQPWTPTVTYSIPQLAIGASRSTGDLMDYMGLSPVNVINTSVNHLPFRAYAKVMSDWFRDENLTAELELPMGDATTNSNTPASSDLYCNRGGPVFVASKYHDYFTSCLPAPQKAPGGSIKIPFVYGTSLPVYTGSSAAIAPTTSDPANALNWVKVDGTSIGSNNYNLYFTAANGTKGNYNDFSPGSPTLTVVPSNLFADMSGAYTTINYLRLAFQTQKFYERAARGGSRYIETLKSQFGVTSPDARLQRSEYLGGNRVPIGVSEVTNNTQASGQYLGDLGGMSRTLDTHFDFVKSFTEHGYIIGIAVVRYNHTYGQGIDRMWSRKQMFDFYWPVFSSLSEQAVYKSEIWYDNVTPNDKIVFGFQEAWAEYRYKQDRCCGYMRPEVSGTLASWHLADDYATAPSLSDSWIREDVNNVDRTLSVTSVISNQYFADFYVKAICTRAMPMYSIPGLLDHH